MFSFHRIAWLGALAATAAFAHSFPTASILTPQGAGNLPNPDGGVVELRWTDSEPQTPTVLELYASRAPLPLFVDPGIVISTGLRISPSEIPLSDPTNAYVWNTAGVPPGCYHVAAVNTDQFERVLTIAPGMVTIPAMDDVPPSLWIANSTSDRILPDGTFVVRLAVSDPDDPHRVTVKYGRNEPSGVVLINAGSLELAAGTTTVDLPIDLSSARAGYYTLYAEVTSADDAGCSTYWPYPLFVLSTPDSGGADAGGVDGGTEGPRTSGCGCGSGATGAAGMLLAPLLRARRRSGPPPR